jgi:nucleoid DNA-binding protein
MTLTRKDIIEEVAKHLDYSKKEISQILNALIDELANSFIEGAEYLDKIDEDETICAEFRGFGTFKVKKMKRRKANIPGKNKIITLPERFNIRFKPVKSFVEKLQKV